MPEDSQNCFEESLVTQVRAKTLPGLFDCVMENRLLCGFLVLSYFFCFFPVSYIFSLSLPQTVKSDYIWPTLYHSQSAYSRVKLCLAPALDVFPGSVLNYGWHLKLGEPWLCCLDFYGWICSQ